MQRDEQPGEREVVAQRLPSFRLGTVGSCIPFLRSGLRAKLGNFPGPRERTSRAPQFGAPTPGGAGDGAGRVLGRLPRLVPRVAGVEERKSERKEQLRTSETAPPPTNRGLSSPQGIWVPEPK